MNRKELSEYAQVTARLIDYWSRQGWLKPDRIRADPGNYVIRDWNPEEADVALWMARLRDMGLRPQLVQDVSRKIIAAKAARADDAGSDPIWIVINDHFTLEVD